ncbi:MAG: MFS transporter [Clostridium sp.]|nr:MFS transporter [Clostridium sp.]
MEKSNYYTRLNNDEKYIMKSIFAVFFINGIFIMVIGPLLPMISEVYNLSDTVSGALISSHFVGNLVAAIIAGILPAYLGRKKSIVFLASFVTVGFMLMLVTGNIFVLLIAFLFIGISRGSLSNFNHIMVNEVSDSRASALNFMHSVYAIGAITAPLVVLFSTFVLGANGWRLAIIIVSVMTLISVILLSKMKMKDIKVSKDKTMNYAFLKSTGFWINAGILFFYLSSEATINGWIVKYFVDANIMTLEYAQVLAAILWGAILVGRLTVAFIGDYLKKQVILLATTLGTLGFYFLLLSTTNITVITIAIIGVGLSMAGIFPTTIANVGKVIKEYPMAMGSIQVIAGVGGILMPIITGALSDRFGILAGMSAIVVALILMVSCVVLLIMRNNKNLAQA